MIRATLKKLDNGCLKVTLPIQYRDEMREVLSMEGSVQAWSALFEHDCCNGWDMPSPDNFALCSNDFLITDDFEYKDAEQFDDDKKYGVVYYYADHQVKCPIDEAINNGYIVLNATRGD